jgi:hypothetical protein
MERAARLRQKQKARVRGARFDPIRFSFQIARET